MSEGAPPWGAGHAASGAEFRPTDPAESAVIDSDTPIVDADGTQWERLDARMILVDVLKLALSPAPAAIALWGFGVEPTLSNIWSLALILLFGVISSARDVVRWITTRYRVTETHVERRTGLFVRTYRSILRERIRSVEAEARLRHRLFRLRMVKIGAGQQNTSGESALVLDAISRDAALRLREELLEQTENEREEEHVIQDVRYHWVVYNIFDSWTYVVAAGALGAMYFLLTTFGVDPMPLVRQVVDWEVVGWGLTVATVLVLVFALGVAIRVWQFFNENWGFRLSRVQGRDGTLLRTKQGLFRTREVDREDDRLRGADISEPLLWRWMRIADTGVITTGLSVWSMSPIILPRGPVSVARRVVAEVLQEEPSPLDADLLRHPGAALRRRLMWATAVSAVIVVATAWVLDTAGTSVSWPWWITLLAVWPVALLLGLAGYLHLGHALVGRYVVMRGKVMSRATSALQVRAISGITVRQSLLQQRLDLATVTFTTAAGEGKVTAADLGAPTAARFIQSVMPDLSGPFLTDHPTSRTTRKEASSSC
jgi:putative membrane protein